MDSRAPHAGAAEVILHLADAGAGDRASIIAEAAGAGVAVLRADGLAQILELLQAGAARAVIVELDTSDEDELLDMVARLHAAAPALPIIVLGDDPDTRAGAAIELGAQDYLTRMDLDAPRLRQSLRAAIHRKRAERRASSGGNAAPVHGALGRHRSDLRSAIRRDEFTLDYQPLLSLASGRTIGVEALLRWRRSTGLVVPPDQFISNLERSGLIVQVGARVLRRACLQLAAWRAAGLGHQRVGVNLSPLQFEDEGLVAAVQSALDDAELEPAALELEITETVLMRDTPRTTSTVRALKDRGVRIAIDDFGTGYSSLAYLHRFPIDTVKIDRVIVQQIGANRHGGVIIGSVIRLAHGLGIEVVAEGVETKAQADFLRSEGCDLIQGWLAGRPTAP